MLRFVEVNEPRDEEVEPAVVVVVEPDGAGGPSWSRDPRLLGHIGERAVAVVAVQNAAPVLRDVKIGKTIAVIVAHGCTHAIAATGDAGLFGHVRECAVAVIAVKGVAQRLGRSKYVALAAVHQVDVHPAVVVIVEESATRASRLGQIFFGRKTGGVRPGNAAGGGRDFNKWVRSGLGCCREPRDSREKQTSAQRS